VPVGPRRQNLLRERPRLRRLLRRQVGPKDLERALCPKRPSPASPILVDGKIYAPSEEGDVFVLAAEPKFEILARATSSANASAPAPPSPDGRLFIRGANHLFCYGKKTKLPPGVRVGWAEVLRSPPKGSDVGFRFRTSRWASEYLSPPYAIRRYEIAYGLLGKSHYASCVQAGW